MLLVSVIGETTRYIVSAVCTYTKQFLEVSEILFWEEQGEMGKLGRKKTLLFQGVAHLYRVEHLFCHLGRFIWLSLSPLPSKKQTKIKTKTKLNQTKTKQQKTGDHQRKQTEIEKLRNMSESELLLGCQFILS